MEKDTIFFVTLFGIAVAVLLVLVFITSRKAWREMKAEEEANKTHIIWKKKTK